MTANEKPRIGRRPMRSILVAVLLGLVGCALPAAEPPYPPSDVIEGVAWDFDRALHTARGSDLWPVTWADDDNVYTAFGDGTGFAAGPVDSKVSYGIGAIAGVPPTYQAGDISGFQGPDGKGKISGILSVGGVLYMTFLKQDGSHAYTMAYSVDHGKVIKECPGDMWPASGTFFPSSFVNFGRDNAGARDEHIYLYGSRWIWTQGASEDIYLARVPAPSPDDPGAICAIESYEYVSGPDADGDGVLDGGTPTWSSDVGERVSVFHDPNGVPNTGMAPVIHDQPLGRYLLAVSHRPPGEPKMAGVGQMGIFEGPEPWGPWRTVTYEDDWGGFGDGEALGYHISTKWLGEKGKTLWVAFSSTKGLDRLNLVPGELRLKGEAAEAASGGAQEEAP